MIHALGCAPKSPNRLRKSFARAGRFGAPARTAGGSSLSSSLVTTMEFDPASHRCKRRFLEALPGPELPNQSAAVAKRAG